MRASFSRALGLRRRYGSSGGGSGGSSTSNMFLIGSSFNTAAGGELGLATNSTALGTNGRHSTQFIEGAFGGTHSNVSLMNATSGDTIKAIPTKAGGGNITVTTAAHTNLFAQKLENTACLVRLASSYAGIDTFTSPKETIWDTEDVDTNGFFDVGASATDIVIPAGQAGRYLIAGYGTVINGPITGVGSVKLAVNGADVARQRYSVVDTGAAVTVHNTLSTIQDLSVADTVTFVNDHNTASTTILAGSNLGLVKMTGNGARRSLTTDTAALASGAVITLDTNVYDDAGYWVTDRFVIPAGQAGRYIIFGQILTRGTVSSGIQITWVASGGSPTAVYPRIYLRANANGGDNYFNVMSVVDMAEGDAVYMSPVRTSGTTAVIGSGNSFFGIQKLDSALPGAMSSRRTTTVVVDTTGSTNPIPMDTEEFDDANMVDIAGAPTIITIP